MSFDPFASGDQPPSEYVTNALPPRDFSAARQRVQGPAIALIVVGILDLLLMILQVGRTIQQATKSPQELRKEVVDAVQKMEDANLIGQGTAKAYAKQYEGQGADSLKTQTLIVGGITCALGSLIAILTLLGGIRMISLRSYGLCIAGAISAAIPCLSCGGACCFGEIIGIWALVVLLSPDVRAAFH